MEVRTGEDRERDLAQPEPYRVPGTVLLTCFYLVN